MPTCEIPVTGAPASRRRGGRFFVCPAARLWYTRGERGKKEESAMAEKGRFAPSPSGRMHLGNLFS